MTRRDTDNGRDDEEEPVPLPTTFSDPADVRAAAELAEAERADARHSTSPDQAARLAVAHEMRRAEDRVEKWRSATAD